MDWENIQTEEQNIEKNEFENIFEEVTKARQIYQEKFKQIF